VDILIVGVSVRGLAESAVRSGLGHRIVAVDHFGDFDLQYICVLNRRPEAVRARSIAWSSFLIAAYPETLC